MTPAPSSTPTGWHARARRAELHLGRIQLLALQRSLAAAAGVRPQLVSTPFGNVAALVRTRPGDAAPIVGIHGFGGDKETWLLMALRLARRRSVVLLDLLGHGGSADVAGAAATPRRYADAIAAALDQLAVPRAVLVGNSLGGGVALRLAHDQPARVAALALVASVAPSSAASETVAAWRRGDNPLIPGDTEDDHRAFIRLVTERPPPVPRAILRYVASRRAGADARLAGLFGGFVDASAADGVPAPLDRIAVPTLIVHGACDRVIPRSAADELAAGLPRAQLEVMAGIGHAPQLEAPGAMARLLEQFLAVHGLAPPRTVR